MKTSFGRIAGLTLIGSTLLASPFADAATPLPKPEKSLLGIRLMSNFKDVLKKFGQPDEIQIGSPAVPQKAVSNMGQLAAAAPSGFGGMAGGGMGAPRMGGMMGGGKMGAMSGGMGGSMGMMSGSMGGAPRMSGMGSMPGMMGGSMGGGRLPGFASGGKRGDSGDGDSLPGFPGGGGGMMPGAAGGGMSGGAETDEPTGESTWWYHVKGTKGQTIGLHYSFLFNKEGKVIQIQQYGYTGGGKTLQGVGLGSTLGQVLGRYGMSNEGNRVGEMAQMAYGGGEQVVFQLLRNRVIGVTLAVTK